MRNVDVLDMGHFSAAVNLLYPNRKQIEPRIVVPKRPDSLPPGNPRQIPTTQCVSRVPPTLDFVS